MFTRVTMICVVIGFFLWLIFADYLRILWLTDRDEFWIKISVTGFIVLFSSFWMVMSARMNNIESQIKNDGANPCKTCGSTSREFGPGGLNAYCPHCGEPDDEFGW